MNAVLAEVRAFVRERRWSVYRQETEEGLLRFLMLREGRQTGDAMVNLVTASPDVPTARALADRLRARCPHVTSVVLNVNPKKAAVAVGVEEHPIAGNETIRERLARPRLLDLGELLLPDEHAPGGAPVRDRGGLRGAHRPGDRARPLRGDRGDQPAPRAPGAGGLRHRARAGRDRGCRPQRAGERHHELHVPSGRGAARAARPARARRAGRRGGRRPAPRRVPPEGAPEPRHAGRPTHRVRVMQSRRPWPGTSRPSAPPGTGSPRSSPSTCSRTRRTSRSSSASSAPPERARPGRHARDGAPGPPRPQGRPDGRRPADPPLRTTQARPAATSPRPRAPTPTSAAERPSARSRVTPRTLSPARSATAQAATPERPGSESPGLRPGREAEQRAERVHGHVADGRHAARVETLPKLVHPAVGRREDEGRRDRARRRGEGAVPEDRQDAELDQVPELAQPEVGGVEESRAGPRREGPEQRQHPPAGPAA